MPKKLTKNEFVERAKTIHGNRYDYSKVEYINFTTKVCIICPIHGEFYVRPSDHLFCNVGCKKCTNHHNYTTEEWIEQAKRVHGDKYDYSKVEYVNNKTKVCIVCPIHGEFWQRPNDHLNKNGCPKCCHKNIRYTTEEWIEQAKRVHGNKYDYTKVKYVNSHTKVCIVCPIHGEFYITPNNHLSGNGCSKCAKIYPKSKMSLGVKKMLEENNFDFEEEKTFDWLKNKNHLYLDFYIDKYKIGIEVQGEQHFYSIPRFGGKKGLNERKECDLKKYLLCTEHGIKLFYITRQDYNIEEIKQYINETANKK